jgi:hypothetical protein
MMKKIVRIVALAYILTLAIWTSSYCVAGCSIEEIARLVRQGYSDDQIKTRCQQFPTWDREGQMIFNESTEYVGREFPTCRYKRYGQAFESCKKQAEYERDFPYTDRVSGKRYNQEGYDPDDVYRSRSTWGECYGLERTAALPCIESARLARAAQQAQERREAAASCLRNHTCPAREHWSKQECSCVCNNFRAADGHCVGEGVNK